MSIRPWTLFTPLLLAAFDAGAQTKDFNPPPLNPQPKEALHVIVSFDRPEDARRYVVIMRARYWNKQSECGYVEPDWNRRFIYPEGVLNIPNQSRDPRRPQFAIFLDRYIGSTCNWELASPDFVIRDTYTGMQVAGDWGLREDLAPGSTYKAVCPFTDSEFAGGCFGRRAVPDTPLYRAIPRHRLVPITVFVSRASAPLHPRKPSFFSNFVIPLTPSDASRSPPTSGAD